MSEMPKQQPRPEESGDDLQKVEKLQTAGLEKQKIIGTEAPEQPDHPARLEMLKSMPKEIAELLQRDKDPELRFQDALVAMPAEVQEKINFEPKGKEGETFQSAVDAEDLERFQKGPVDPKELLGDLKL